MTSILPDAPPRDSAWPSPLPPVLSPSSINTFLTCSEQWRRVYLQGEWSRPDGALVIGGADSSAAEHNFLQKISSHEDLPLADVEYVAAGAFEQRIGSEEVEWKDKPGEDSPGAALDTTIRVVRAYHTYGAPPIQPLTVEAPVELQVEGVVPLVRAYVDLTTAGRVISRKTSAKKVSAPKRGWLNQSAIESAATGLPTSYHIITKAASPAVLTPVDVPGLVAHEDGHAPLRAARLIRGATEGILAYLDRFGPDEPWPGNIATFVTPCSYCAFQPNCWWWK